VGQCGRAPASSMPPTPRSLRPKCSGPADPQRRHDRAARRPVARKMARSGWSGCAAFGAAAPGMLATCGCSRLEFPDGSHGILVAAGSTSGRAMPLGRTAAASGRRRRPADRRCSPATACSSAPADAARPLLGFRNLIEAGLDDARSNALSRAASKRLLASATWCCNGSATAPISAWSQLISLGATQAAECACHRTDLLPEAEIAGAGRNPASPLWLQPPPDYDSRH